MRQILLFLACAWSVAAGTLPPMGPDGRVACPYCDLRGESLAGRDLRFANFVGADLAGANLNGAKLGGAALAGANLAGADLRNAVFSAATDLTAARLTNARLNGATLDAAVFLFADLTGADLSGTDSSKAIFGPKRPASASAKYYCGAKDTTELHNVRYVEPPPPEGKGEDSPTCGASLQSPCATVQRGIANCTGEQCAVLVAFGEYKLSSTLLLTGAVSVYGGCEMTDGPNELRSNLHGPDGAPAAMASRIVAPTTFQGFSVFAGAGRPTSIAFASILSSGVSLVSVSLTAGVGARSPEAGEGKRAPNADNGREDIPGRSPGNAGGGQGGNFGENGKPGKPGDTGFNAPQGNAGLIKGSPGDPGRSGPCQGPGIRTPDVTGTIDSSSFAWRPSVAGGGVKGGFGGGGGGGGSTPFRVGGGGGAGGEGGGGGDGGIQGGASIGLLIVGGRLTYTVGAVRAGKGGSGGRGGNGAPRGVPGNGATKRGTAGIGGNGGLGGPGTGGAGGNGGPAFAVATAGTAEDDGTFIGTSVELYPGTPGEAGKGGNGSPPCVSGNDGLPGITVLNQRLEIRK